MNFFVYLPLALHVPSYLRLVAVLANRTREIPIRPKLLAPQPLLHLWAPLKHLPSRDTFDRLDIFFTEYIGTRESGVCEKFGYQVARRKACILLVSCRWVTNFAKMEPWGVFKRNSGRLWRSAMATTSSEGGMPGRMVRSQEPKEFQTSRGWATARY